MRRVAAFASLLFATSAQAQPEQRPDSGEPAPEGVPAGPHAPEPPPVTSEEPAPEPTAPAGPVTALDGDARNYERAPRDAYVHGAWMWRGLRTGLGYAVRVIVAPFRGLNYLEARWHVFTKARVLVNAENTLGIVPTLAFTSDFGLNYGARAFIDDYFGHGEEVSLTANTGGAVVQAYQLKVDLKHLGAAPLYVRSRVRFEENENLFFAGVGNPDMAPATRFSQTRFLGVLSTGVQLGDHPRLRIGGSGIFNDRSFGTAGSSATDPSIETAYDTSMLNGFESGYRTLELTGEIELDTRDTLGPTQHGGMVRAFAGGGSLIGDADYMHYGAEGAYFVTPWWPRRTFVGRVALDAVRDRDDDIPFTELPRLGGAGLLRGFHTDQFRDKLAAVATLEYHYPIHENFSGQLFVETGEVGRTYDQLAAVDHLHTGYGGGLIWHRPKTVRARIDVAYGDGVLVYFSTDVLDAFRKREREL